MPVGVSRNLALLFLCQFTALVGDRVTTLVLVTLATAASSQEFRGTSASLVAAVQVSALLFFSYLGGALADRYAKPRIIAGVSLARVLLVGFLSIVAWNGLSAWAVFIAALGMGLLSGLFNPSRRSLLPFLSGEFGLQRTNQWSAVIDVAAMLVGIGLGIVLLGVLPPGQVLVADAIAFMFAFLLILGIHEKPGSLPLAAVRPGTWASLEEGLRYLKFHPLPRSVLLRISLPFYSAAGFFYAGTNHWAATQSPDNAGAVLGRVLLPLCAGALGGFFLHIQFDRQGTWSGVRRAFVFGALTILPLTMAPQEELFIALVMVAVGIGVGALYYRGIYLLQKTTGRDFIGRVMGVHELVASGAFVVSILISSAIPFFDARSGWVVSSIILGAGYVLSLFHPPEPMPRLSSSYGRP